MNNNTLVAVIVGVVVIGGGAYFLMNAGVGGPGQGAAVAEAGDATFAQAVASGQPVTCTYEYNDGANVSSGTVYLASGGERIRGDFTITQSAGGPMEAHMVRDGGYNYIWGSFYPQGVKTKVTAESEGKLFDSGGNSPVDENTTYHCSPWSVDESMFSLPSGVEFMDIGAQVEQSLDASLGASAAQCAACDEVPEGAARAQCLVALGCN